MSTTQRLRQMRVGEHFDDPRTKQRLVTAVFEVVSGTYDRFTRLFSYGMDQTWKRELLAELAAGIAPEAHVLDLACGTGDVALAAERLVPAGSVIGLDISSPMLESATRRMRTGSVARASFCRGDMMHIALPDASVDAVTVSYGIRNAPDYGGALDEITRVLKPGGLLLTLDFFRPANPLWRRIFLGYLWLAGSAVGWWWHRVPIAYGYIAPSVERFVSWQRFADALKARGFVVHRVRRKLLGGICIHAARLATAILLAIPGGNLVGQTAPVDTTSLSDAPHGRMQMLWEKTIFKVDVLTLEVRFDHAVAQQFAQLVQGREMSSVLADSIAAVAVEATDVWARIRFERNVSLNQFVDGVRDNAGAARDAGLITDSEFAEIYDGLPQWYAFLADTAIKDGDEMFYRIRGDTLRTIYRTVTGETRLDRTDVGRFRRLSVMGGYFAPKSDFRKGLIASLFDR